MKSVNSMLGIGPSNSADREDGERLPEGEKYFGLTNVLLFAILIYLGIKYMLCEFSNPSFVPLQKISSAGHWLQASKDEQRGTLGFRTLGVIRTDVKPV